MKKPFLVKIRGPLEPWALHAVASQPGIEATWADRSDLVIDGSHFRLAIECKRRVDPPAAWAAADQVHSVPAGTALLVIAETTTARAREILESAGVAYVDADGYANVRLPGVLIRTTGVSPAQTRRGVTETPRLAGKGGAIAESLLLRPGQLWSIDELADEARSSAGLTHRVLTRLEVAGMVEPIGSGPTKKRRVIKPGSLLDLWAEEERDLHRTETLAYCLVWPGTTVATLVSERLDRTSVLHAVTGTAAAAVLSPSVTATPVSEIRIAASAPTNQALVNAEGREVVEGYNLVFVQASDDYGLQFRRRERGVWLASNPRVYLDLLRDPRRGREQAKEFRDSVLEY